HTHHVDRVGNAPACSCFRSEVAAGALPTMPAPTSLKFALKIRRLRLRNREQVLAEMIPVVPLAPRVQPRREGTRGPELSVTSGGNANPTRSTSVVAERPPQLRAAASAIS